MNKLICALAVLVLSACGKTEPPFNDPRNIVIDGKKITAKEYLATYCKDAEDGPHCKRAREFQTAMDAVAVKKPKGVF